jgi:putative cardiolipin synthase
MLRWPALSIGKTQSTLGSLLAAITTGAILITFLGGCDSLPDNAGRTGSAVITDGADTRLGRGFGDDVAAHPDLNGVLLLAEGRDAFVARALLARLAERSIDTQYYMWHQDTVGRLLIKELVDAADRGVRVRLLVDDMYGSDGN